MGIIKEKQFFIIDHANKQVDNRLRVNPNRASKRQATQCEAKASNQLPGNADNAGKPSDGQN